MSGLDKTVKVWDLRTGFSEVGANLTDTLPWDVKVWNSEKDLAVGCDNGELGVLSLAN